MLVRGIYNVNHFKRYFKIYFSIYCGIIILAKFILFIFAISSDEDSSKIIEQFFEFALYAVFYGVIIYSLITNLKHVYKFLIPVSIYGTALNMFLSSFSGISNLIEAFSNIHADTIGSTIILLLGLLYSIGLGTLIALVSYQIIVHDTTESTVKSVSFAVLLLFASTFIFALIAAIKIGGAALIMVAILEFPISFILIMTIATKSFVFDDKGKPVYFDGNYYERKKNVDLRQYCYTEENNKQNATDVSKDNTDSGAPAEDTEVSK